MRRAPPRRPHCCRKRVLVFSERRGRVRGGLGGGGGGKRKKKTYSCTKHGIKRLLQAVQAPEDSGASGLDALVETSEVGGFTAGVGESAHVPVAQNLVSVSFRDCNTENHHRRSPGPSRYHPDKSKSKNLPVNASLPRSIVKPIEHVQEHGSDILLSTIRPIDRDKVVSSRLLASRLILLPRVSAAPDSESQDDKTNEAALGANRASGTRKVQSVADDDGAENLGEPVQRVVERAGAGVELGAVHVVGLVRVEGVGGEEHGKQENDPGGRGDGLEEALELGDPRGVLHHDDLGAIVTLDFADVAETEGEDGADKGEDQETDVGAVGYGAGDLVDVLAERDQGADHGTQVEDDPEPRDVAALHVLGRVGHHDGALGGPEETSAHTEESAGEDDEAVVLVVVIAEEGSDVDDVSQAAER